MSRLEHREKREPAENLVRLLSAALPEFTPGDTGRVRVLAYQALDDQTDAIALRRLCAEIEKLLGRATEVCP